MTLSKDCKVLELFSEDIAQIRGCVWDAFECVYNKPNEKRRDELDKMMETIYNALYCSPEKRIILEDKDRRGYD